MTTQQFWEWMDDCRKSSHCDTDLFFQTAQETLSQEMPEKAAACRACLGTYREIARKTVWLDMGCKVITGYVRDDTALYFTLWLISCGENILLKAFRDPDSLAERPDIPFSQADFHMLMMVAFNEDDFNPDRFDPDAMGKEREKWHEEIVPSIVVRNKEKYGNYEHFEDAREDIPNVLPKLIARAEKKVFAWKNFI